MWRKLLILSLANVSATNTTLYTYEATSMERKSTKPLQTPALNNYLLSIFTRTGLGLGSTAVAALVLKFLLPSNMYVSHPGTLFIVVLASIIGEIFVIYKLYNKFNTQDVTNSHLLYYIHSILVGVILYALHLTRPLAAMIIPIAVLITTVIFASFAIVGYIYSDTFLGWEYYLSSILLAVGIISVIFGISYYFNLVSPTFDYYYSIITSVITIGISGLLISATMNEAQKSYHTLNTTIAAFPQYSNRIEEMKDLSITAASFKMYQNYIRILQEVLHIMYKNREKDAYQQYKSN